MAAKKFTVLIIPEGSHQVRRFNVRRSVLQWLAGIGVVMLVTVGLLTVSYFRTHLDRREFARLKSANSSQQMELQRLTASLQDLRQEMVVLAQNDAKVRVLARLSKPHSDTLAGIGGPSEEENGDRFSALQKQIDAVRQAIDLRRESQEEIQGFLNDRRSLLGAKPSGWPIKGWVTSGFGMRESPFSNRNEFHPGLDIAARTGTPVHATAAGVVSRAEATVGYGNLVVIDHGYGFKTYYGHNSRIFVKVGQRIKRGQVISAVGDTGRSTGPHCHYEVRVNGLPVNPRKYL